MNNMNATANEWTQIEPLLDDAMAALDKTDRAAILLRYFETKPCAKSAKPWAQMMTPRKTREPRRGKITRIFLQTKSYDWRGCLAILISANAFNPRR